MTPEEAVTLHIIWRLMKDRCENPNTKSYPAYGGRGIYVCDRWQSFNNFAEDVGARPSPDLQLDRVDNDGPYSPENCRWATRQEQCINRRSTRFFTINGKTQHMKAWAQEYGLSEHTFAARIRRGWNPEDAGSVEAFPRAKSSVKTVSANGETLRLAEWARRLGCNPAAILYRIKKGWSEHDAVTVPVPERPNSKLTTNQVMAIRAHYPGKSAQSIAKEYGVSKKTVLNIIHRKIFRDVT